MTVDGQATWTASVSVAGTVADRGRSWPSTSPLNLSCRLSVVLRVNGHITASARLARDRATVRNPTLSASSEFAKLLDLTELTEVTQAFADGHLAADDFATAEVEFGLTCILNGAQRP